MRKIAVVCMVLLAVMLIAPAAFAQGNAPEQKAPINTTTLVIAVGFGVAVAAFGGGLGQGRIAAATLELLHQQRQSFDIIPLACVYLLVGLGR